MSKLSKRLLTVLLSVVWLAVVGTGLFLAITRREEYGFGAYIAIGIAVFMLAIFGLTLLPKRIQKKKSSDLAGKLSVAALVLLAIAVLVYHIIVARPGIFGTAVLGLFTFVFVRIFIDLMKEIFGPEKKHRERSRSKDSGEG